MIKKQTKINRHFSVALLRRGFRKVCPQCGEGPLVQGYLKPLPKCSTCNEDFSHISADDGPAWLTLLVVGHAVVPLMLVFGRNDYVPLWLAVLILSVVTLIGVYFILPRAKGIFIALIWLTDATGQNESYDTPDLKREITRQRRAAALHLSMRGDCACQSMKFLMNIILQ